MAVDVSAAANELFTTAEAKLLFGVDESTIRNWASHHLIHAQGQRGKSKLYPYGELAEADRTTRSSANLRRQRFAGRTMQ